MYWYWQIFVIMGISVKFHIGALLLKTERKPTNTNVHETG